MMYWGNGMGGWGYVLMMVSMLLFWGLLIAGVVLLVRYVGSDRGQLPSTTAGPDPRSLLDGALTAGFDETRPLLIGIAWLVALGLAVTFTYRRGITPARTTTLH